MMLSSFFYSIQAQEILGNSIDDDGDCNIDCDDLTFAVRAFQITNYQEASFVIGQDDFVSSSPGTDEFKMNYPYDIALDPLTEKVFSSDVFNHRVLRYASINDFIFGNAPEAVIGQVNFTSNSSGTSSTKFNRPTGIFVDHEGTLWITDYGNNRLIRYDNASFISSGAAADGVLGQVNFTSNGNSLGSNGMDSPTDLLVSLDGTLWLSDLYNGRILRFDNAKLKANGASADGVLGAPDFTTNSTVVNSTNLRTATGLTMICGNLYASDALNNRILRWNSPAMKSNGAPADGVLGQPNFTSSSINTSANGLYSPQFLETDKFNNLYVSDDYNNRVVIYDEANSKTNGANADRVLGQSDFISSSSGLSNREFIGPRGINVIESGDRSYLVVTDTYNNRILIFGHEDYETNETTAISSTLPGYDASGTGGLSFFISAQPQQGTVVVTNSSTGAFTYTPSGACPYDYDYNVMFTYSINNALDCYATGEIIIRVSDVSICVEDCTNGIDDDLDCLVDCEDEECGTQPTNFTMGMDASFVVGQDDFVSNSGGTTDNKFMRPYDIARDPTTGKIFLSDPANNRVLRYASYADFITNEASEIVLGQVDFTSNIIATTASNLYNPRGIFVDDSGALWISDTGNHRVLRFNSASTILTGASADGVLGQSNFTLSASTLTATGLRNPKEILAEADGTLWVADHGHGRILRYDNAATKLNGAAADGVLGQIDFTSEDNSQTDRNLYSPEGIVIICDALYVADEDANRVLRWDNPKSLANGASASVVLGQPDFISNTLITSQNRFRNPRLLATDYYGNLYITSAYSETVRVFESANEKSSGADSDYVLGQSNFTNTTNGLAANRMNGPRGMAMIDDNNKQLFAVCDGYNRRVVVFGQDGLTTDELTSISSNLPGIDPSGSGGLTFGLLSQPSLGSVTLNNSSTGIFTYTPEGVCPLDDDYEIQFAYTISNVNGCASAGNMIISVDDAGSCVEDCTNGVDDDLNGLLDQYDPACDFDGDSVINRNDLDNDNDGILDEVETNFFSGDCPYTMSRVLFNEDFGDGMRKTSHRAKLCFEDSSSVSCSANYNASTYSRSVDPGEYSIVSNSDFANVTKYNWVATLDATGIAGERMIIFNPSSVGQIVYEFEVDGIIPNISSFLSFKNINLFQAGSGEQIPNIKINVLDASRSLVHTSSFNILENGSWNTSTMSFNYGLNTSVIIQFVNEASTASGNDFAFDNIVVTQNIRDCDNDGQANMYDLDSDNDGIPDIAEQGNPDINFNGMTDNITGSDELLFDVNNNGADDTYESDPMLDTDSDLYWDILDLDSDNDGIYDVLEAGGADSDLNGIIGTGSFSDPNNNGLSAIVDPLEGGAGLSVKDSDSDGNIDSKELDSDGDGCVDVIEAGFPDGDSNGYLGTGTIGSGLMVNNKGIVTP